jgi:hypothetical protein
VVTLSRKLSTHVGLLMLRAHELKRWYGFCLLRKYSTECLSSMERALPQVLRQPGSMRLRLAASRQRYLAALQARGQGSRRHPLAELIGRSNCSPARRDSRTSTTTVRIHSVVVSALTSNQSADEFALDSADKNRPQTCSRGGAPAPLSFAACTGALGAQGTLSAWRVDQILLGMRYQ